MNFSPLAPTRPRAFTAFLAVLLPAAVSAQVVEPMASAITFAEDQMRAMIVDLGYGASGTNPDWASNPSVFPKVTDSATGDVAWSFTTAGGNWGAGYTPGIFWDLYELTGDALWQEKADAWTTGIDARNLETSGGDMRMNIGFHMMNSLARRVAYDGGEAGDDAVLATAADTLESSWMPAVGSLWSFSWGRGFRYDGLQGGFSAYKNTIVDSTPNLEIFFHQAKRESDATLWSEALSHFAVVVRDHIRADGSTVQLVAYGTVTGDPVAPNGGARGHQGYGWNTTWSRGQGWALHGFATAWRETGDHATGDDFHDLLSYYRENAPADGVPYWDFAAPDLTDADLEARYPSAGAPAIRYSRDSSAAALAASSLLEACNLAPDPGCRQDYFEYGLKILTTLSTPGFLACDGAYNPTKESILRQGSYTFPGVDKGQIWGDFYYVEALRRYRDLVDPATLFGTDPAWGDWLNYATLAPHLWRVQRDQGDWRLRLQASPAAPGGAPSSPALFRKYEAADFSATFIFRPDEVLTVNLEVDAVLVFAWTGPNDYCFARFSTAAGATGLYAVVAGTVETVATTPDVWSGQAWHDFTVSRAGAEVTLSIGDAPVLTHTDARLGAPGHLGLASLGDSALFDEPAVTGSLTPTELSPRGVWREARFSHPAGFLARDEADPENNGQSNLADYALGTFDGQAGLRIGRGPGGTPRIRYPWNEDFHDVIYRLRRSIDRGASWQTVATHAPSGAGGWQEAIHDPDPATHPHALYRVEVLPLY